MDITSIKMKLNGRHKRFLLNKHLYLCVRLVLGIIFVWASIDKVIHPAAFAEAVYNYQILPHALINLTAIILPWLELILGVSLILGLWFSGAVLLSNLLLITFVSALVFNMARGLDIDCGCFSTSQGPPSNLSMGWYVFRDGIFLLLGLYLLFHTFWWRGQKTS